MNDTRKEENVIAISISLPIYQQHFQKLCLIQMLKKLTVFDKTDLYYLSTFLKKIDDISRTYN